MEAPGGVAAVLVVLAALAQRVAVARREVRVAAMEGAALSRTGRSSWNEDPAG